MPKNAEGMKIGVVWKKLKIKVLTSLFGKADRNSTLEAGRPGRAHLRSLSAPF